MTLKVTPKARADIRDCLLWSARQFGKSAARRYKELLEVSILELAEDPQRSGSRELEGWPAVRLYHLRHSRKRAPVEGLVVKRPRHFIAYRIASGETIEILRILHDSMDVATRLEIQAHTSLTREGDEE